VKGNAAIDKADSIIVRLNCNNAGALIDAVELVLAEGIECPAFLGLAQVERGDLRIVMISDEHAVKCYAFFIVLGKRSRPKQGG